MTKNIFVLIEIIYMEAIVSIQMVNQNFRTMFFFKGQEKNPKMVMVWIVKSPHGLSKPVFYLSGHHLSIYSFKTTNA